MGSGKLRPMPNAHAISVLLTRELEGFRREVASFADDEVLWRTLPGIGNSGGNLALHVAGNLQHFVGALLGQTGYARNRAAEFSTRAGTRGEVDRALAAAIDVVRETLAAMTDAELDQPMRGAPNNLHTTRGLFLMHLVAHAAFHLGQAGYLRRVLSGAGAGSAGPLPIDVLETPAPERRG